MSYGTTKVNLILTMCKDSAAPKSSARGSWLARNRSPMFSKFIYIGPICTLGMFPAMHR
jgi:hypothetical protein